MVFDNPQVSQDLIAASLKFSVAAIEDRQGRLEYWEKLSRFPAACSGDLAN